MTAAVMFPATTLIPETVILMPAVIPETVILMPAVIPETTTMLKATAITKAPAVGMKQVLIPLM